MASSVLRAVLCLVLLVATCLPAGAAQIDRPGATSLVVYNGANTDVTVMVTVEQASATTQDGCPTAIQSLNVIDIATGKVLPLTPFASSIRGWFILKRGARAQVLNIAKNPVTKQTSSCLQGVNLTFGELFACPGPGPAFPDVRTGPNFNLPVSPAINLPNGSNAFECALNLPGTIGGQTAPTNSNASTGESVDISCVNGANCTIQLQLTPPVGGPYWTADLGITGGGIHTFTTTTTTKNSWVDVLHQCDANCVDPSTGRARTGVFPYGCTQCNTFPDPAPPCAGQQFCAAKNGEKPNNGCGYNRGPQINVPGQGLPPVQKFGGTLLVTYLGPLSPPGTCPPGSKQ